MFLPQPKRDSTYIVGAFFRMIATAIPAPDSNANQNACGPNSSAESAVSLLHEKLDDIYAGKLELPEMQFRSDEQHILHALGIVAQRYEIPRELFLEFAQGLRDDTMIRRYPTWSSVEKHCDRIGGSVARALACVLGVTHSEAGNDAAILGKAIRLTQVLRDISNDWNRGKLYLPLEDIVRFRYGERDLSGQVINTSFRELMQFEITRARELLQIGSSAIRWLGGDGGRAAASSVVAWHLGILDAIERHDYDVFSRRAELTFGQKLRAMPRAWKLLRSSAEESTAGK